MLKPKKIIRVLSALLLLILFWGVLLLIQELFSRQISHHELHIPKNATSVLELKNEDLIQTFVQDVLLEKRLESGTREYITSPDSGESPGIDYLSNTYIFTIDKEAHQLVGILINLKSEKQFQKAMQESTKNGFGFSSNNGVGLMLFDDGAKPMSRQHLNTLASEIVQTTSGFNLKKIKLSKDNSKANYWAASYSVNNGKKTFSDVHLSLFTEGKQIKIDGFADFQSTENRNYPVLVKKDLNIQTQFIPNYLNDLWLNNTKNIGVSIPKLTYVCGNYHYLEPSPVKDLKILPNLDGIYGFEQNFDVRAPLIALLASQKIDALTLNSFKIGDKTIYYKQIDPKTFYLGQTRYQPAFQQGNALLEVNGDLKQLLKIRNGGMVARFLSLSPEYNTTERFLSGITASDIRIDKKGENKVNLSANLTFQDDKSALNETLRLFIHLGLLD